MNDKKLLHYIQLLGLTNEEFANYLGISYDTLKNWLYRNKQVPKGKVEFVANKIKLHQNYTQNYTTKIYNDVTPKKYSSIVEVKLVTTKARAGYTDSYYSEEYLKDLPTVLIDADKDHKGNYLAFEVDGDSMEPEYYAGDIVICREVKRDLWQYKLHYKEWDFVIAHGTQGVMLKEITDHNTDTGEITCHSLNQDGRHKDFKLNLKEVSFLYNVVEHRRSGRSKRRNR